MEIVSWWAAPGIVGAFALAWVAGWVFRSGPDDALNRRLAFYIAVTATYFVGFFAIRFLVTSPDLAYGAASTLYPAALAVPFLTARFLRPLAGGGPDIVRRRTVVILGIYTALAELLWLVRPDLFLLDVSRVNETWSVQEGLFGLWLVNGANTLALGAVLWSTRPAARAARPSAATRMKAVSKAFLAYGIPMISYSLALIIWPGVAWFDDTSLGQIANVLVPALAQLMLGFMLALGILRAQLVSVSPRARRTIAGGGLTVFIALAFVVISEILENTFSSGGLVSTLASALVIAMLLRPVQNLISRAATRILPPADPSREERLAVYEDTVAALLKGGLDVSQTRQLERLKQRLQLGELGSD